MLKASNIARQRVTRLHKKDLQGCTTKTCKAERQRLAKTCKALSRRLARLQPEAAPADLRGCTPEACKVPRLRTASYRLTCNEDRHLKTFFRLLSCAHCLNISLSYAHHLTRTHSKILRHTYPTCPPSPPTRCTRANPPSSPYPSKPTSPRRSACTLCRTTPLASRRRSPRRTPACRRA